MVHGRDYKLRAYFSRSDGKFGMRVRRCFSFSDTNNTVQLVDDRGCVSSSEEIALGKNYVKSLNI